MADTPEPWKLLLCMVQFVHVLRFATEEAAGEAEDFYAEQGYNTCVVKDEKIEATE